MQHIRLSKKDLNEIIKLFHHHFPEGDRLWIFGSRVELLRKGGDLDLYIETQVSSIENAIKIKTNFLWDLEHKIGEQKIDIVLNILNLNYQLPIYQIALNEGVRIV